MRPTSANRRCHRRTIATTDRRWATGLPQGVVRLHPHKSRRGCGLLNLFVINDNDSSSTASRIDGLARGARSHVATEGAQLFDLLRITGSIKNVYEGCAT